MLSRRLPRHRSVRRIPEALAITLSLSLFFSCATPPTPDEAVESAVRETPGVDSSAAPETPPPSRPEEAASPETAVTVTTVADPAAAAGDDESAVIDGILSSLTAEEKIGQMMMVGVHERGVFDEFPE